MRDAFETAFVVYNNWEVSIFIMPFTIMAKVKIILDKLITKKRNYDSVCFFKMLNVELESSFVICDDLDLVIEINGPFPMLFIWFIYIIYLVKADTNLYKKYIYIYLS